LLPAELKLQSRPGYPLMRDNSGNTLAIIALVFVIIGTALACYLGGPTLMLSAVIRGDARSFLMRVRGESRLANGPRCRAVPSLFISVGANVFAGGKDTIVVVTRLRRGRTPENLANETHIDG
jgi:hypothetical protein